MKCRDVIPNDASSSRTSSGLLRAAQANDPHAWVILVNTYSRVIYRWCRQADLQPADAANVVQDVLRSVARKLPDFRHSDSAGSFRGWLRTITRNKLRDTFRREIRHVDKASGGTTAHRMMENLPDQASDSVTVAVPGKQSKLCQAVIEQVRSEFSQRDWHVFWRITVDGQSAREAGEEFGMTANAARIVKMRVLRRLRELYEMREDASA